MKINHLIIGTTDAPRSAEFYCELLQFEKSNEDPGAKDGLVLKSTSHDKSDTHLLLIPMNVGRLPNPAHVAFECISAQEFVHIFEKSNEMNLSPRSTSSIAAPSGYGEFTRDERTFRQFYVFDPDGVNVEVMVYL